jgi:hypothetical protein
VDFLGGLESDDSLNSAEEVKDSFSVLSISGNELETFQKFKIMNAHAG